MITAKNLIQGKFKFSNSRHWYIFFQDEIRCPFDEICSQDNDLPKEILEQDYNDPNDENDTAHNDKNDFHDIDDDDDDSDEDDDDEDDDDDDDEDDEDDK